MSNSIMELVWKEKSFSAEDLTSDLNVSAEMDFGLKITKNESGEPVDLFLSDDTVLLGMRNIKRNYDYFDLSKIGQNDIFVANNAINISNFRASKIKVWNHLYLKVEYILLCQTSVTMKLLQDLNNNNVCELKILSFDDCNLSKIALRNIFRTFPAITSLQFHSEIVLEKHWLWQLYNVRNLDFLKITCQPFPCLEFTPMDLVNFFKNQNPSFEFTIFIKYKVDVDWKTHLNQLLMGHFDEVRHFYFFTGRQKLYINIVGLPYQRQSFYFLFNNGSAEHYAEVLNQNYVA